MEYASRENKYGVKLILQNKDYLSLIYLVK